MFITGLSLSVVTVILSYVVLTPYTKVEESFNIQAVHDLLHHRGNVSEFDHVAFPGVVPRTFIGPLMVSILTAPFAVLASALHYPKIYLQYVVRGVLGILIVLGFAALTKSIEKLMGKIPARFCTIITLSQFHFFFYASRPLPNIFALSIVLPALAFWVKGEQAKFVWLSAFAIVVFRFELCILFGACLIVSLCKGSIGIKKLLIHVFISGATILGVSVCVDSYFWRRWVWPEGEVMWFNVVMNKSSNWGISPFHWYFTSALPRCLLTSAIFLPWGVRSDFRRTLPLLIPALVFVCAFSILPHKELRFIIYTIPLFNAIAARGYTDIWLRRRKSLLWGLCATSCLMGLVVNLFASLLFLAAATNNYAGGEIFRSLHNKIECRQNAPLVHVHICNLAAQSGVSRFGEECPHWTYNKTENIPTKDLQTDSSITHVIMEVDELRNGTWSETHYVLDTKYIYSGLTLRKLPHPFSFLPIPYVKTRPALVLLQRMDFAGT